LEVVQQALAKDGKLGPQSCGWHYVEGLTEADNPEIAIDGRNSWRDRNSCLLNEASAKERGSQRSPQESDFPMETWWTNMTARFDSMTSQSHRTVKAQGVNQEHRSHSDGSVSTKKGALLTN
jgi:hypothetical protein